MIIYFLILTIATMLVYIYQRMSNFSLTPSSERMQRPLILSSSLVPYVASFFVLLIPAAIRFNVGSDYMSYLEWFKGIATGEDTYFEPAFVFIIDMVAYMGLHPQWVFAFTSCITLLFVFLAIYKGSTNPALSVFLFIAMAFYFISFNIIRQFVGVAVVLFSFGYILNGKFIKYLLLVLGAGLFHMTAYIMIPVYFLLRFVRKKVTYLTIIASMALASLFKDNLMDIFLSFYPIYQGREDFLGRMIFSEIFIGIGVLSLLLAAFLVKTKKMNLKNDLDRIIFNVIFLSLSAHLLLAWIPAINRLLYYIDILYVIVLPLLISRIPRRVYRILITTAIGGLLVIYLFISIYLNGSYDVIPYQTIFSSKG